MEARSTRVHINQIIKHSTFSVDSMIRQSKINDVKIGSLPVAEPEAG